MHIYTIGELSAGVDSVAHVFSHREVVGFRRVHPSIVIRLSATGTMS